MSAGRRPKITAAATSTCVRVLPDQVKQWRANPVLDTDHIGPIPRVNLSIKITALDAGVNPTDTDGSIRRLVESLRPILEAARDSDTFVNFDMEQYSLKDLTIELFERCCEEINFAGGLAVQAYLRSGEDDIKRLIAWAKRTGKQVTVRLIKGAYWDYEVVHAEQMGWPVPVWSNKRETDANFERMAELIVAAMPRRADEGGVKLALGTHNVRSISYSLALLEKYKLPQSAVEVQMLYGMADQLKPAIIARGLRLREYAAIGEMVPGMGYLVRRLLENTSNESWLKAGFFDNVSDEQLLASPHTAPAGGNGNQAERPAPAANRPMLDVAAEGVAEGKPFVNEPLRDFSRADVRERFQTALRASKVPTVVRDATADSTRAMIGRAAEAFTRWRNVDWKDRSAMLIETARRMRERRDELSGIMIREAGKPWREADADTCEAIDFCEYYARSVAPLFQPQRLGRYVGELNTTWYEPRGVAAVISPWNFPLAICTGMTTAALVTGNTVIVKPSAQTMGIAKVMCDILWQSGVPADVLQLLAGPGAVVGSVLVRDPRVPLIAFTGSKEVGLDILAAAGQVPDGQPFLKKVVCEMGGKNAIIIDESADLDEAVPAVRQSAFGYCGQKCSACSRVIVVDAVYDVFLSRLVEACRSMSPGDPMEPGTGLGPVIDAKAAASIREYIEIGKKEGKLELACEVPAGLAERTGRDFVAPHIFSGIQPHHRLANEEVFGPVLAVIRAADFDEALKIANSTTYKLTGGLFSRKPSHLETARREFRVGNLYLNRGCTGALVGRQPFGGFGLSGTGTKAGGADYLLHFVEPRSCCENTMRRGFAPGMEDAAE